jgi:tetratricopeptide (TPR) repeat protein
VHVIEEGQKAFSFMRYRFKVFGLLLLLMHFPLPAFSKEAVDLENYRRECSQGMTIYCLAAGMEEQKSGNLESALKFYKSACENHSSRGHLRACTPFLSLASQMQRLGEASSGLEALCREGDDVICFYLAKEYFKIAEYHRGFVHLERLCRENFQSPDALDYGPCYHLGMTLKKIDELGRAEKVFSFDCSRDPVVAQPSCDQAEAVKFRIQQGASPGGQQVKALKAIELAALGVAAVPLMGLVLLRIGRKTALKILRIPVPLVTLFCWVLWEPYAERELDLRTDLFFIVPAVTLALLLAWSAHRELQN